jgi:transposase
MRGKPDYQGQVYYSIDIEGWIAPDHPLRAVKRRADSVLASMHMDFEGAYSDVGRPSIPPEMLLKALLSQALSSVRSERQLVEQIQMNLLYKWFIDLSLDAPSWNATTFTKNRERFEKHGLLRKFLDQVVERAYVEEWASDEHFTVDGTLIESYASLKNVRPKDSGVARVSEGSDDDDPGNPTVNFRGERRKNETHGSVVDPEARLYKKRSSAMRNQRHRSVSRRDRPSVHPDRQLRQVLDGAHRSRQGGSADGRSRLQRVSAGQLQLAVAWRPLRGISWLACPFFIIIFGNGARARPGGTFALLHCHRVR